ncbi:ArsA family ATPase [Streptomyces sp. HPF1205]|uniref:ArsA family ATPase n=1 Tax=Streptomyces sp. HPF1205 TaxID=2873262 RepID=UPI001CEC51D2|nr:ArsA-related P-loop ATPase [Streptomyces sp. HPF1205]
MAAPRTLLVTGAPGAGRTTVAAATATAAARAGGAVLVLTADREASRRLLPGPGRHPVTGQGGRDGNDGDGDGPATTSAVTGLPVPYPVDGVDGLYAAVVDSGASFRAEALNLQGRIGGLLALLGAAPLDPEELTELPGADTMALLRALRETHPEHATAPGPAEPAWDLVVVDLPPVREAVRLLALPGQLRRYLGRLLPADRQAARALRPVLAQLAGVPMPAEWAYEAADRADRELAGVQAVIEDPGTAAAVVLEPGPDAERTLRTARAGLSLYGHRLAAVLANRVLPTGSADPFLTALFGQQQVHLKALAEQCAADGVPLRELPHLGREPRPGDDLAVPPEAVLAGERTAEPWTVADLIGTEGHLLWTLPLPGATREGLDLVRRGDELVVDAAGFRRILPLPSALRRCTVSGAALRDEELRVRFTPDPGLWPR